MQQKPLIFVEPPDVERRLGALGIQLADLTEPILIGDGAARLCSPFEPANARGMMMHLKATGDCVIVAPPLIADRSHVDTMSNILRKTLQAL